MPSVGALPAKRDEITLRVEGWGERQEMSNNQGDCYKINREGLCEEEKKNEERDKENDQCSLVSSQGNKQPFKETGTPFQLGQLKKMSTTFLPELFLSMATALY